MDDVCYTFGDFFVAYSYIHPDLSVFQCCAKLMSALLTVCSSDTEDEKAHKIWKKSIMLVWRSAANHK